MAARLPQTWTIPRTKVRERIANSCFADGFYPQDTHRIPHIRGDFVGIRSLIKTKLLSAEK
jgi:hypothetical protein